MSWITSENGLRAILGKNVYNKFKAVFDACCGGISTEGDPTKFLNQKGEFATITSNSTKSSTQLLGSLIGADFNTTADQAITLSGGTTYIITDILFVNSSMSIVTSRDGQIFTGAARTNNQILQTSSGGDDFLIYLTFGSYLNNRVATQVVINGSIAVLTYLTESVPISVNTLYFSLGTPEGSAATADIYIFGFILQ